MANIYDLRAGQKFKWRGRIYVFDRIITSSAKGATVKAWPVDPAAKANAHRGKGTGQVSVTVPDKDIPDLV